MYNEYSLHMLIIFDVGEGSISTRDSSILNKYSGTCVVVIDSSLLCLSQRKKNKEKILHVIYKKKQEFQGIKTKFRTNGRAIRFILTQLTIEIGRAHV